MVLSRQISQQGKGVGSRNLLPPVSQTYPFLRFLRLKASKRGRFEKFLFSQTTLFPVHFLQKGGLSFEFGPRCLTDRVLVLASGYRVRILLQPNLPFLRFSGVKLSKRGGFEKSFPTNFSNLLFLRFSGLKEPKRCSFEKSSPANFLKKA